MEILDPGVPNKERVLVAVDEPTDLSSYVILQSFAPAPGKVAPGAAAAFWFPSELASKGDAVVLLTGPGQATKETLPNGRIGHVFFWGLQTTVFNNSETCVVLIEALSWETRQRLPLASQTAGLSAVKPG